MLIASLIGLVNKRKTVFFKIYLSFPENAHSLSLGEILDIIISGRWERIELIDFSVNSYT